MIGWEVPTDMTRSIRVSPRIMIRLVARDPRRVSRFTSSLEDVEHQHCIKSASDRSTGL